MRRRESLVICNRLYILSVPPLPFPLLPLLIIRVDQIIFGIINSPNGFFFSPGEKVRRMLLWKHFLLDNFPLGQRLVKLFV